MPVAGDVYRAIAGSFPTGVVVVTVRAPDGTPKGLTTQTFVGLSLDPPLVLVALAKSSRTLAALRETGAFVANVLRAGSEDVADRFATKDEDKFRGLRLESSSVARGAPILREASVAYAECVVRESVEAGDHWVVIASVEGGAAPGGTPLLYYRRTYAAWPEERPAPPIS